MAIALEWDYYLQAFRLHQGLSKGGNAETQRLLRRAVAIALENGRVLPRAYGLQSFTVLNAWLSDWVDGNGKQQLLADAIGDVQAVSTARGLPTEPLDALKALGSGSPINDVARCVIQSYAATAVALDGDDFENRWSLATADLYSLNFAAAFEGYATAMNLADAQEAPEVSRDSLAVDFADALYFAGQPDQQTGHIDHRKSIEQAIILAQSAIDRNSNDPKRHRWNWTLGWAYYELGFYVNSSGNYERSLGILNQIRSPHHLILKNLIASNMALGEPESIETAKKLVSEFKAMEGNAGYTLAVEDRWPYRNGGQREHGKKHLKDAGL